MADIVASIYRPAEVNRSLRQGEILSDLCLRRIDPATVGHEEPILDKARYPFAVVLSQDCDVTQQKMPPFDTAPFLPCVLLAEVTTAQELRWRTDRLGKPDINSALWKQIQQNREERYHYLEAVAKELDVMGEGLAELAIDFKRYLAVPTDELYALISAGLACRRCVLNSPYMEHLCNRFGNYLGRIALPEPHKSVSNES